MGKIPSLTNIFQMGWNHQPEGNNKIAISPWMAPDPQAEGSTEPKEPEKKEAEVKDKDGRQMAMKNGGQNGNAQGNRK